MDQKIALDLMSARRSTLRSEDTEREGNGSWAGFRSVRWGLFSNRLPVRVRDERNRVLRMS
jgi:hypothetical protein